jgi:hypothetical protein
MRGAKRGELDIISPNLLYTTSCSHKKTSRHLKKTNFDLIFSPRCIENPGEPGQKDILHQGVEPCSTAIKF